ncbi:hypothetical protein B0H16DRAFT_1462419 [Mycena metata]|uniref:Uncharacterized protein n=1 Tax=Mycena metata TaxID=1033252 RepID=A0AAD7IQ22_9AGAR|nr:hypothetical protein B0H16DRAFT_1462419 [Mycena metata]
MLSGTHRTSVQEAGAEGTVRAENSHVDERVAFIRAGTTSMSRWGEVVATQRTSQAQEPFGERTLVNERAPFVGAGTTSISRWGEVVATQRTSQAQKPLGGSKWKSNLILFLSLSHIQFILRSATVMYNIQPYMRCYADYVLCYMRAAVESDCASDTKQKARNKTKNTTQSPIPRHLQCRRLAHFFLYRLVAQLLRLGQGVNQLHCKAGTVRSVLGQPFSFFPGIESASERGKRDRWEGTYGSRSSCPSERRNHGPERVGDDPSTGGGGDVAQTAEQDDPVGAEEDDTACGEDKDAACREDEDAACGEDEDKVCMCANIVWRGGKGEVLVAKNEFASSMRVTIIWRSGSGAFGLIKVLCGCGVKVGGPGGAGGASV